MSTNAVAAVNAENSPSAQLTPIDRLTLREHFAKSEQIILNAIQSIGCEQLDRLSPLAAHFLTAIVLYGFSSRYVVSAERLSESKITANLREYFQDARVHGITVKNALDFLCEENIVVERKQSYRIASVESTVVSAPKNQILTIVEYLAHEGAIIRQLEQAESNRTQAEHASAKPATVVAPTSKAPARTVERAELVTLRSMSSEQIVTDLNKSAETLIASLTKIKERWPVLIENLTEIAEVYKKGGLFEQFSKPKISFTPEMRRLAIRMAERVSVRNGARMAEALNDYQQIESISTPSAVVMSNPALVKQHIAALAKRAGESRKFLLQFFGALNTQVAECASMFNEFHFSLRDFKKRSQWAEIALSLPQPNDLPFCELIWKSTCGVKWSKLMVLAEFENFKVFETSALENDIARISEAQGRAQAASSQPVAANFVFRDTTPSISVESVKELDSILDKHQMQLRALWENSELISILSKSGRITIQGDEIVFNQQKIAIELLKVDGRFTIDQAKQVSQSIVDFIANSRFVLQMAIDCVREPFFIDRSVDFEYCFRLGKILHPAANYIVSTERQGSHALKEVVEISALDQKARKRWMREAQDFRASINHALFEELRFYGKET